MAMVGVDSSSLQACSRPKSVGVVWTVLHLSDELNSHNVCATTTAQ